MIICSAGLKSIEKIDTIHTKPMYLVFDNSWTIHITIFPTFEFEEATGGWKIQIIHLLFQIFPKKQDLKFYDFK